MNGLKTTEWEPHPTWELQLALSDASKIAWALQVGRLPLNPLPVHACTHLGMLQLLTLKGSRRQTGRYQRTSNDTFKLIVYDSQWARRPVRPLTLLARWNFVPNTYAPENDFRSTFGKKYFFLTGKISWNTLFIRLQFEPCSVERSRSSERRPVCCVSFLPNSSTEIDFRLMFRENIPFLLEDTPWKILEYRGVQFTPCGLERSKSPERGRACRFYLR